MKPSVRTKNGAREGPVLMSARETDDQPPMPFTLMFCAATMK